MEDNFTGSLLSLVQPAYSNPKSDIPTHIDVEIDDMVLVILELHDWHARSMTRSRVYVRKSSSPGNGLEVWMRGINPIEYS
jgi:hypothetical protein